MTNIHIHIFCPRRFHAKARSAARSAVVERWPDAHILSIKARRGPRMVSAFCEVEEDGGSETLAEVVRSAVKPIWKDGGE